MAAVTPKVVLDGIFAEIVLDDEPWLAPGDARPLGRQLRSVTVGGVEVLEELQGGGVHARRTSTPWSTMRPARWRWTSGRRPFYVPVPIRLTPTTCAVDGEPVAVRATCRLVNHAGSYLERHGVAGEYGLGAPDDGRFDHAAERFGFSGTAPVFRAETLRRLGGLAPQFFAYNEDTDWCLRARLAGLRILYDPAAVGAPPLVGDERRAPASPMVRFLAQRNALLCLVRNAPAHGGPRRPVAPPARGPGPGCARPCSPSSRGRWRRGCACGGCGPRPRAAVWDRWAGCRQGVGHEPRAPPAAPTTTPARRRLAPRRRGARPRRRLHEDVDEAPARVAGEEVVGPPGPAATNCLRSRSSSTTRCTDGGEEQRGPSTTSSSPASATVSGTAEVA